MSFRIDQLAVLNLATVGNSITAGSFVRSGGTSSQFLKADGTVDTNAYITGITSGMVTTALGYTPVPNTRNITINGVTQDLSVDRTWTISAGVSSVTGSGSGISVSPTTGAVVVSNTGVTSNVAGTGISVSGATGAVTITNTGVTSIVAGTAITISGSTGAVTINNAGVTSVNGSTGALTGFATQAWVTSQGYITSASVGNGTLTLAVSGSGLSGSASFTANQSTATTFTVTSNATNANTASTIVFRDASGNFSAGTITAALSGNATTASTWQTARTLTIGSTGKSVNGSADVSWSLTEIGAPSTTGTGASGTWGISITGNSATVSTLATLGTGISYNTDRTVKISNGLAIYGAYNGGANSPWTYDLAAQFIRDSRGFEFSASWHAPSATLAFRTLRDCCDNWSSWVTMLSSSNYNSYSPTLTGGGASGTWSIDITGSAGSASSASSVPWAGVTAGIRTNYNLVFQPPSNSYAGFEFSTSTGGGAGYFLVRGTSDTDVYTAEGITLVADAGWLTLAQRTTSNKGVRIMTGATSTTRIEVVASGMTTVNSGLTVLSGLAWNNATPALNVGGSGDGRIQVRHIWGKSASSSGTDHLWLQYSNTGNHVQIGDSGGGNNLYVSGNIYMNGYFAGNLVATQSWVTSQGYITGNQTITLSGDVSGSGTTSISVTVNQIDGWSFVNTGSNAGTAADSINSNGISYVTGNISLFSQTDGALYSQAYNSSWQHQIYGDYRTGQIAIRGKNNGTWQSWRTVLDSTNYNGWAPTLTGGGASGTWSINITGNAATATNATAASYATYLTSSNYIQRTGSSGNYNTDFSNTPAGSVRHLGDDAGAANNPGGSWWFVDNYRHSNSSNIWGTQIAWGWEDNANRLAQRNVTGGSWSGWVYYLNSGNYNSYAPTLTGGGASGTWSINITGSAGSASTATSATQVVTIQDAVPSGVNGQLWWESDTGRLKVYYGASSSWVDATAIPDMSLYYPKAGGVINGDVGIQQTLTVVGNTLIQGTLTETSDISLKENIIPLNSSLDKVMKLKGVSFNKKATPELKEIGFIAQEVEAVIPDLVTETKEGIKTVSYSRVTAVLVETIKEQQVQINELKNLVSKLTDKLNNL